MSYAIYLRKSRADLESEANGELETLAKHERQLKELASKLNLNVTKEYKEVVSGETISARPQMQELLRDVQNGLYEGVLVMEIERLARGDTIDQGLVAQTFKYSDTKIITPTKTYDPNNEYDEEYFEFGLFMSRREYKTIKRRLQAGRARAVKDGKFIGNTTPYGYNKERIKGDTGFKLVINEEEAKIVRLIYQWFISGDSKKEIKRKLDAMKMPTRYGKPWNQSVIKDILYNPTYIGKIPWLRRGESKKMIDGKIVRKRPRNNNYEIYDGLHEPIIDMDTWEKAQVLNQAAIPKVPLNREIQNPLSGIIFCAKCGHAMQRRPYLKSGQIPSLICVNCDNISSRIDLVEEKLLQALNDLLKEYSYIYKPTKNESKIDYTAEIKKELANEKSKLDKLYTFLENGTYSSEEFLERSKVVKGKISELENLLKKEEKHAMKLNSKQFIPVLKNVLATYENSTIKEKNELLKTVLEKVTYLKTKKALKLTDNPYEFELVLYPKIQK